MRLPFATALPRAKPPLPAWAPPPLLGPLFWEGSPRAARQRILPTMSKSAFLLVTAGPLRLAVAAEQVVSVFPLDTLARVPATPPWILGLSRPGGRLLVVVDPALLVGRDESEPGIGVHLATDLEVCLAVEAVETSAALTERPGARPEPWLVPALDDQGRPVQRLDVAGLVTRIKAALESFAPAADR